MGKMPDSGWMGVFAEDRETVPTPWIRLEDAQAYFKVGDRVGFFTGPAHRITGVIEKVTPPRAWMRPNRECAPWALRTPSPRASGCVAAMPSGRYRTPGSIRSAAAMPNGRRNQLTPARRNTGPDCHRCVAHRFRLRDNERRQRIEE